MRTSQFESYVSLAVITKILPHQYCVETPNEMAENMIHTSRQNPGAVTNLRNLSVPPLRVAPN